MTLRDKEHEDRIEEVGNKLTSPPTDVQQLLLLLDKAENFLSKVVQCPPQSMHTALRPSMKALISMDLLKHSDLDVKVAVASCLSEITRITAPDAPFEDDLMKEIFRLIVGALKNLDEMSSHSFSKRVSILETVAKVRSCVLMLDLECDDLILDMFHHFLNTIRSKHSYIVLSSMETIMTLVIEESENISTQLLSCMLDYLKIDGKNIIPPAKKLAEKVLVNCALKLKPYMVEFFRGIHAPLDDYSEVVSAVYHGNLGTSMQNDMNSCEAQADDSKFSDRTPDELPQGSAKHDHKVVRPEKAITDTDKAVADAEEVVTDADGSSKTSNGTFHMGNGDSFVSKQKMELFQPSGQLRDTCGSSLTESDNLGSGATRPESGLNLTSLKGGKRKATGKLTNNHHSQIDDKEVAPAIIGRGKCQNMEAELSKAKDSSFKELETSVCLKAEKRNKLDPNPGLNAIPLHSEHGRTQSKKGRPPKSKSSHKRNAVGKAAIDGSSSAPDNSRILDISQMYNGDLPMVESSSKKSEVISESEKNLLQFSASKSYPDRIEVSKTTTTTALCDSETLEHDRTSLSTVSLHIPNVHQGTHSRKGRSLQTKRSGKRNTVGKSAVDGSSSSSVHEELLGSSQRTGVDLLTSEPRSKNSDVISLSKRKHSSAGDSKADQSTTTRGSETKCQTHRSRNGSQREIRETDFSAKKHNSGTKLQKGEGLYVKDDDKEVKLKELLSLRKSKLKGFVNDQILVKNSNEAKYRRKRARDTQETFGTKKRRNSYNSLLVGSNIRVWWPDDERFYDGVVDSFDRSSKKHRILYNDGDVEVLFLKKEKWEPIEIDIKSNGVQGLNFPDVSASKPTKKKARGRHGKAALVETKTVPQLKVLDAEETESDPPSKSTPDPTVKNESNGKVRKRKGQPSKPNHSKSSEKVGNRKKSYKRVDDEKTRPIGKVDGRAPTMHGKPKRTYTKSGKWSRKKSGDASYPRIKSKEVSTTTVEAGQKPGRRPAKVPSRKVRVGTKPKIVRKLSASDMPRTSQAKAGRPATASAGRKKRR